MSETPGIGTKVQADSFLSQFNGQSGAAEADIISGATFSSRAVIEAVNKALDVEIDVYEITENENAARAARMMQ
jgi:Na+-translocating ferredoxin:NAD+ oxidoreductase RnfG subunit